MNSLGRRFWNIAAIVFLLALVVRTTAIMLGSASLQEDPDAYARIAVTLAKTGTIGYEAEGGAPPNPTAYRPPLYPWLLSWLVFGEKLSLPAVGAMHVIMGITTVLLTARIGLLLGMGKAAWWAAAGVAIDPLLIRAGQQVMTETIATLLSIVALYFVAMQFCAIPAPFQGQSLRTMRHRSVLLQIMLGGTLGLAILARPTAAPWVLWVLITLAFNNSAIQYRWKIPWIVLLTVVILLTPWTARNFAQFGKPIWSTTHGGYTLLLANNPSLYSHFRSAGPSRNWDPSDFHSHWAALELGAQPSPNFWSEPVQAHAEPTNFSEVETDQIAYRAAWNTISDEPSSFLLSCVYRVIWLWHLFPNQNSQSYTNWSIGLWYGIVFSNALFGAFYVYQQWRLNRDTNCTAIWVASLGLVVSLTIVHSIFWSNMRMRAPAMPVIYLLSLARYSKSRCV